MKALALILVIFTFNLKAFSEECNDKEAIYKICSDQVEIYNKSTSQALAQDKFILVKFGADWCPWCHSLHALFNSAEFTQELGTELLVSEIGLYNGKDFHPTGSAVFHKIIKEAKQNDPNFKGVPFLAVVNPITKKVVFLNTAHLELNTKDKKGHDQNKVFAVLKRTIENLNK